MITKASAGAERDDALALLRLAIEREVQARGDHCRHRRLAL